MTVQSAQSVTVLFTTRIFSTGVGTNADSLPAGTLYLNGTSNGATVTVTNLSAGLYKAQVTLPTLAIKDEVQIAIAATVSAISDTCVIWTDTKDILLDASGDVTFNNTTITTVTGNVNGSVASVTGAVGSVTGLTASNLDATVSSRMATYTQPTGFLVATFPTGTVSNTTNITAGTITTTTNLTNAPTAGDFTATMKTSLNNSTPSSVTTVTGNVNGSVGSVTSAVGVTSNLKKNQALAGYQFLMTDSTTHTPKTGVTITATRSLDGAAFGACANSATEISNGWYQINLAAADLNANNVALRFTGTNADDRDIQIITQP